MQRDIDSNKVNYAFYVVEKNGKLKNVESYAFTGNQQHGDDVFMVLNNQQHTNTRRNGI